MCVVVKGMARSGGGEANEAGQAGDVREGQCRAGPDEPAQRGTREPSERYRGWVATTPPGSFLEALDPADRDALLAAGHRRRFPRGTVLLRQGERSGGVVVLLSGYVKVSVLAADGTETLLAARGPGDLLGELACIDGKPHSATAIALGEVEAVVVDAEAFRTFLAVHGRASTVLLRTLSLRLRDADRQRVELGSFDATSRVCSRLVELAVLHGRPTDTGIEITLPLSQEELAAWTGSSREAVAKVLRRLRERGLVETRRRRLTVADLDRLTRLTG